MLSRPSVLLATAFVAFVDPAAAFWRLLCDNPVTIGRYDPIVSPGAIAGHVHTISGGSGFGMGTNYAQMRNASCTSCQIKQDLSNYWIPQLYYQNPNNGSFEDVQTIGGMTVYYLQRGDNPKAFPPGFQMLAGNPFLRSAGSTLEQQAINFVCLDYSAGSSSSTGLPTKNCPQGLRAQIVFPSCWNGKDLDSADHKSHMAYPDQISSGNCPANFPVRLVTIFYEVTFIVDSFSSRWYSERQQPFVFAQGDPTGYGLHGDMVNGWDQTFLQSAIDTCGNPSGLQEDCPLFDLAYGQQCHITPQVNEVVSGNLTTLPGCNPVQFGPGNATPQTCSNQKIPQVWNDTVQYKGATAPPKSHFLANQAQTVQNYSTWQFVGCYSDGSSRTLPDHVGTNGALTVENCLDSCNSAGYAFGGPESGSECWCGNASPASMGSSLLTYEKCFQPCPGNPLELCGGNWALSVYNNSAVIPPAIPLQSKDGSAKYLGCYTDNSTRTMEYPAGNTNSTVDGCVQECSRKGYPFSGVEYKGECYCSANQPSSSLVMPDIQCGMQCSGDSSEFCGGAYRLQVYQGTPISTAKVMTTMPYAGCYTDGNHRSLSHSVSSNNTVEGCLAACMTAGYAIAGVEYGGECWCDNVVAPTMAKVAETDCNMKCAGNKAQICGAGNRLSVYNSTALVTPSRQTSVGGLSYAGCWVDDGNRVMTAVSSKNNTVNGCVAACTSRGYSQAGVQYGGQCFCGPLAARSTQAPDSDCSMSCSDDPKTFCGAGYRLQVYNASNIASQSASASASAGSPSSSAAAGRGALTTTSSNSAVSPSPSVSKPSSTSGFATSLATSSSNTVSSASSTTKSPSTISSSSVTSASGSSPVLSSSTPSAERAAVIQAVAMSSSAFSKAASSTTSSSSSRSSTSSSSSSLRSSSSSSSSSSRSSSSSSSSSSATPTSMSSTAAAAAAAAAGRKALTTTSTR